MTTNSTAATDAAEEDVARRLERAWDVPVYRFAGRFNPIDFYGVRDERMSAVIEIKTASYPTTQYPYAMLTVRKWLTLTLAQAGLGVPALFVVAYTDEIRWACIDQVDATQHDITGRRDRGLANDREPRVRLPVASMRRLLEPD